MRTAIIGSRGFNDLGFMTEKLKDFSITSVVSGKARGADRLASAWAYMNSVPLTEHIPEWDKYPKSQAAFIRNKTIIDDCEQVVAFWDGFSPGTKHAINIARTQKKPVYIFIV